MEFSKEEQWAIKLIKNHSQEERKVLVDAFCCFLAANRIPDPPAVYESAWVEENQQFIDAFLRKFS